MGVPFTRSPERALRALGRLAVAGAPLPARVPAAPLSVTGLQPGTMSEHASKQVLASCGIAFPRHALATHPEEAWLAAEAIGYPVALKAQSAALPHKTEAGGVLLRIGDRAELKQAWLRLHDNIARHRPGLVLDGVLVEAMGRPGTELIMGARRDPLWGPVLLAGLGGVMAEALEDVRLMPADLAEEAIAAELLKLKGAALLRGFRGAPAADLRAAAALLARLGAVIQAAPDIAEIDLNPVMVYPHGEGALALDALIVCS